MYELTCSSPQHADGGFAAIAVSRWSCVSARSRPHFGRSDGHKLIGRLLL